MIEVGGITYVTATEAPGYLGADVTAEMVRAWGSRRKLNGYRVGRETFYSLDELTDVEFATRNSRFGKWRKNA